MTQALPLALVPGLWEPRRALPTLPEATLKSESPQAVEAAQEAVTLYD